MADLKAQVAESAHTLKAAWIGLQGAYRSSLPQKCFEQWTKRATLYMALEGTVALFPVRDASWNAVLAILSPPNIINPERNVVAHGSLEMDFAVARHLALTSYVAVTWSAYDRLANVCGRIAGIANLAGNPKQNPKACEDFLGKKDTLGFSAHLPIQQAYGWPLKVTYKIRNWLVHEGYEEGSTPLFMGERIADEFTLHDDAVRYLERLCEYKVDHGKIEFGCLKESEECWPSRDLLAILDRYHAEIDIMFESLLKWSVTSLIEQIKAFTDRDRMTSA